MLNRLMGTKPETQELADSTFTTLSKQIDGGEVTHIADLRNKKPGVWAAYRAERKLQVSAPIPSTVWCLSPLTCMPAFLARQ